MVVSAVTIQPQKIPVQCPPVAVPPGTEVDPADCSTVAQSMGVECRLRCVQPATTDDGAVTMTCSASRQWAAQNVLHCLNDTVLTGLCRHGLTVVILLLGE